jgi:hypothetical protein
MGNMNTWSLEVCFYIRSWASNQAFGQEPNRRRISNESHDQQYAELGNY